LYSYSRLCEEEADSVGLEIAAAACYDSRSAASFWQRHHEAHELASTTEEYLQLSKYFSTHPLSIDRHEDILEKVNEMDALSEDCGCTTRQKELLLLTGYENHSKKR